MAGGRRRGPRRPAVRATVPSVGMAYQVPWLVGYCLLVAMNCEIMTLADCTG